MTRKNPAGLLVLYEEKKGVKEPDVKLFNPSPTVERDVNAWIDSEPGLTVHRIDWLPSGGLLGASVLYSRGAAATEAIRITVPGLESVEKRLQRHKSLESLALAGLTAGVALGLIGMVLFSLFYPETWYGDPQAIIDPTLAVKSTVLVVGLGIFLIFAGIAALVRARIA